MRVSERLAQIGIVLKDTTHPGNIGAAARAMKAMGVSRLSLVAAKTHIDGSAKARAAAALDVLEAAVWHNRLPAALAGYTHVYAYSARRRGMSPCRLTPRTAAQEAMVRVASGGSAAFLFGGERSGLENEDILHASAMVEIPTDPSCTSLNLAQAVQIACYELRQAAGAEVAAEKRDMPTQMELEAMLAHLQAALAAVGLPKQNDTRPLLLRLRRLLARAEPDASEVRLLRGVWRAMMKEAAED